MEWGCEITIQALSVVLHRPIIVINLYKNSSYFTNISDSDKNPVVLTHHINHYAGTMRMRGKVELNWPAICIDLEEDEEDEE